VQRPDESKVMWRVSVAILATGLECHFAHSPLLKDAFRHHTGKLLRHVFWEHQPGWVICGECAALNAAQRLWVFRYLNSLALTSPKSCQRKKHKLRC